MSAVCKWISGLCIWENHKKIQHQVHPDQQTFEAIIIWREKAKQSTGGVAYDVILKPASSDLTIKPGSPPKEQRAITQEAIADKLKKAQERRESIETQKLEQLQKDRERAQQVLQKAQEENTTFSKSTQEKLRRSLELNKENRQAQIKALQERLREHEKRIEEVRKNKLSVHDDDDDDDDYNYDDQNDNEESAAPSS